MSAEAEVVEVTPQEVPGSTPQEPPARPSVVEDADRIVPEPFRFTLRDGTEVEVERLRTRQFLRLLRILTRGGMEVLPNLALDLRGSQEQFVVNMMLLFTFAIPEAEQEAIEFLRSMVRPVFRVPEGAGAKAIERARKDAEAHLARVFENPELDDAIGIIEAVIRREAADLMALGRRLASLLGQRPEATETETGTETGTEGASGPSSEGSPGPST
jgi:hypothetical protein